MALTEYIGHKYGHWTVIGVGEPKKYKTCSRNRLICRCLCGNIRVIDKSALLNGRSRSCYCMGVILKAGEQYNEWTVIGKSETTNKHNDQFYDCKCSCGITRAVRMADLLNGASKNCGHSRTTLSFGASAVKNILDLNKIDYYMEYIFEDLPRRKFDFAIHNNGVITRLVELDEEKVMKEARPPFVWNVLLHDWNAHDVRVYNVLSTRREDYIKKLKKKCATKEEFIELLDRDLLHQFWSRSEYEMILYIENDRVYLEPWCGTFKEGRIDITDDDTLNWPVFARAMLEQAWTDKETGRKYVKFDVYDQLKFRFDELIDFVWNYKHKYRRIKKEETK